MGIKPTLYSLGLLTTSLGGVSHGYPKQPLGGDSTSSKDPNRKQSLSGLRPLKKRGGQQADGYLNNLSPWCEVLLPFCFVSLLVQSFSFCDPMDCSTPGFPVHHQLLELSQTHVHQASDGIQPSHPLSSPSPPAPNPSQHQGLFQ